MSCLHVFTVGCSHCLHIVSSSLLVKHSPEKISSTSWINVLAVERWNCVLELLHLKWLYLTVYFLKHFCALWICTLHGVVPKSTKTMKSFEAIQFIRQRDLDSEQRLVAHAGLLTSAVCVSVMEKKHNKMLQYMAFLYDWLWVFKSQQTKGWNGAILQEPRHYNDLLFNVLLMWTSYWSSLQHGHHDKMSDTRLCNVRVALILVFWQVLTCIGAAVQSRWLGVHRLASEFGLGSNCIWATEKQAKTSHQPEFFPLNY